MPTPTSNDDLAELLEAEVWERPAARELALWFVTLTSPAGILIRPAWAARVAWHALTRRKRFPRG